LREGGYLEDIAIDEGKILKWILKKWDEGKDWIDLAQDRDRCRALVSTVMNIRFP
jgi:hypothetical protein